MGVAGVAGRTGEVTRAEVLRAGRRRFFAQERIDLVAIARELGIARATVYRWFGGRNDFEGQVLWSLASDTLDRELAKRRRRRRGAAPLIDAVIATLCAIVAHPGMRHYLDADPQRAMVVLTGYGSFVGDGLRGRLAELIAEHCPEAATDDLDTAELAYTLVRVAEAYCYSDVIAGREADPERARPVFHRLLEV